MSATRAVVAVLALLLATGGAAVASTTQGTEFWACHSENEEAAQWAPLGLAFANQGTGPAFVVVEGHTGSLQSTLVQPGRIQTIVLPNDRMLLGTIVKPFGYHVVSDKPIRAFQFNPVLNSRSDDATCLLPTSALGVDYVVMSRSASVGLTGETNAASLAVVAASVEPTNVTIVPACAIAGSIDGRVPPTPAGTPIRLVLERFDAVQLVTDGIDQDPTGTRVTADRPVAVFGAHVCADIPEDIGYCDHLEEQVFPLGTWGTEFVAVKSWPRSAEPDFWRVVAAENGTTVTLTPDVLGGGPIGLAAGRFVEFATAADVHVVSTAPIQVGQFFVGRTYDAQTRVGDPSMIMAVPVQQLDTDYLFLTPANYLEDYVTILVPEGSDVSLDGLLIPPAVFTPVGASGYSRARLAVADGVHRVTCPSGAAVYPHGYDVDVSYGYSAGSRADLISSPIFCDAGGPYQGCAGGGIVELDGRGSNGPGTLAYTWSVLTPGLTLLTPDAPTTQAILSGEGPYTVALTVSNGVTASTCTAVIPPATGLPPQLTCPGVITATPTELRGAWVPVSVEVVDDCDPDPVVRNDRTTGGANATDLYPCGATAVTFTAVDDGGSESSCTTFVVVQEGAPAAEVSGTPDVEPLRVTKAGGGQLAVTFELRADPSEAYNLMRGTVPPSCMAGYDHVGITCGQIPTPRAVGIGGFFVPDEPGANWYFLVSVSNCFREGGRGTRSDGVPRPDMPMDCGALR